MRVKVLPGAVLALFAFVAPALAQTPVITYCFTGGTGPTAWQPCGTSNPSATTVLPSSGTGSYSSVTIGASSAQALAAGSAKVFLDIANQSASATIACAFGVAAVLNGAGSITIPPLWHRSWEGTFVPTDAVNCIASSASTPATIGAK